MIICKFCKKECKNKNSLRNHERLCPSNPNRNYTNGMKGKKGSNQFIKAKEEGREIIVSEDTRKKHSDNIKNRSVEWHKENGKKISETINRKVEEGNWHTSLAKHIHINYKLIDLGLKI